MAKHTIETLSVKLAELYQIDASWYRTNKNEYGEVGLRECLLVEDSARMAELEWENDLEVRHSRGVFCGVTVWHNLINVSEEYKDHSNKSAAARFAIARCLLKMRGEK